MNSSANNEVAIRFDALCKSYGRQRVLERVSLNVYQGEFFGLVGVNGAGKTTCIKGMLDFCALDGGGIDIFGEKHVTTRARRRLAYLPERFLPPYYLTGRDFLNYMSKLYDGDFADKAISKMLETLDLDSSVLEKPVRDYSKGMAQKQQLQAGATQAQANDNSSSGEDPRGPQAFSATNIVAAHGTLRPPLFPPSHS